MVCWRRALAAVIALVLQGVCGDSSPGEQRRLSATYSVSQRHSLKVREDGLVDIFLSIDHKVALGKVLAGNGKTILSDFGTQGISGPVVATDDSGRSLPVRMSSKRNGWLKVEFDFPQPVDGTSTPLYTVHLAYTVSNGVCTASTGHSRFEMPWAHRWMVRVVESTYEIEFANALQDMSTVCFGTSGFRMRCGSSGLTIAGAKATHKAAGSLHGVFFEWATGGSSARSCEKSNLDGGGLDNAPTLAPQSPMARDAITAAPEEEEHMAAMTVGLIAVGSSMIVGGALCACARKVPLGREVRHREVEEMMEYQVKADKLELEEECTSESTAPSLSELPGFASRRFMAAGQRDFPDHLKQVSPRSPNRNWTQRRDSRSTMDSWDVPEEFQEEELAALSQTGLPEYSIQVSEHRPASSSMDNRIFGKLGSEHQHPAEMDSIKLHLDDGHGASDDPFAVEADCDDEIVEDGVFHSSAPRRSALPTMALTADGITLQEQTSGRSLRVAGHMQAEAAYASPSWLATISESWEPLEEYDDEDSLPHRTASALPESPPASTNFFEGGSVRESNFKLPPVLNWTPGGEGDPQAYGCSSSRDDSQQRSFVLPPVLNWAPAAPEVPEAPRTLCTEEPLFMMLPPAPTSTSRRSNWEAHSDEAVRDEMHPTFRVNS